ncbi:hypothetical protein [Legionella sp.]|uniref:hypothetical protein n=1 Tax=Legionella sp. TaxID=459 RepID=UPI00321F790F
MLNGDLNMNLNKKQLITMSLCALFSSNFSYASTIVLKNDDTATLTIDIEAGEGTLIKDSPKITQEILPGEEKKINVTSDQFGDKSGNKPAIFSVKGSGNIPSMNNRCSGLSFDRNYKIVFVGTKAGGVVCYREEISGSGNRGSHTKK